MNQLDAAMRQVDALLGSRQTHAALALLRQLIEQAPGHPGLLFVGARTAVAAEELSLASSWLGKLESSPLPNADLGIQVARLLRQCGLMGRAEAYVGRLRQAFPDDLQLLIEDAAMARSRGDGELARSRYREALDRQPGCGAALVYFARDRKSDPERILAEIQAAQSADDGQDPGLWFAAGRCSERLGQHQAAFDAYARGNEIYAAQGSGFGLDRKIESAPGFIAEFSREQLIKASRDGHASDVPAFVVGMPRSGTTLTEQIISAHPEAGAVGERRIIGNLLKQRLSAADTKLSLLHALTTVDGGLESLGEGYLSQLSVLMPELPGRVVDKMPFNFTLVGPCHLIFPNATIIHTERDPLDVCWSMFTTGFRAQALRLSLTEIGQLYALHEYLMDHWRGVCPVYSLSYQALVEDFEVQTRRLIEATGLDWHPDCLDFHRGTGDVRTASAAQVRQPIYASSLGRAAAYQPWLGDFEHAREQTLKRLKSSS